MNFIRTEPCISFIEEEESAKPKIVLYDLFGVDEEGEYLKVNQTKTNWKTICRATNWDQSNNLVGLKHKHWFFYATMREVHVLQLLGLNMLSCTFTWVQEEQFNNQKGKQFLILFAKNAEGAKGNTYRRYKYSIQDLPSLISVTSLPTKLFFRKSNSQTELLKLSIFLLNGISCQDLLSTMVFVEEN